MRLSFIIACVVAIILTGDHAINGQESSGNAPVEGTPVFDGVTIALKDRPTPGFRVRDVAADTGFLPLDGETLGLRLEQKTTTLRGATFVDVTLTDTTGKDRALTLVYALRVPSKDLRWLENPRRSEPVAPGREYVNTVRFRGVANERLSRYPFAAVADAKRGIALGIDMSVPAFFGVGYNAATEELFLAYDLGLTPEKPSARLRLCHFRFEPEWGFRAALARYYELFPEQFRTRVGEQGLWMPFAPISKVKDWQDFGFRFKEGDHEADWDDRHDVLTFHYTEPMTWWMRMPDDMSRDYDTALAEAHRRAEAGDARARALLTSGFHDASGRIPVRFENTPWCNGAVWSMNSMPGIAGDVTSFKNRWSPEIRKRLYGPAHKGTLDGEYVDSSEAWVTDDLDFRRDHFRTCETPLTFSAEGHRPAIFKGLISFEYVRAIARDVHAMDKRMMANGTPSRLCWLAPMLDVMGTETDWNRRGRWRPMSDADLLYRRSLSRGKPWCFLMNTRFERLGPDLVEKYMKRSLAYGMFPGFFSHNASQGQYFKRPELYERDRPLFRKYMPLVKRVAEAGWEPVTRARSSDERVHVERFGERYLTVFNDSDRQRTAVITFDGINARGARELVTDRPLDLVDGAFTLTLEGEDVAVILLDGE